MGQDWLRPTRHGMLNLQLTGLASARSADFVGGIGDLTKLCFEKNIDQIVSPQVLRKFCWGDTPFFGQRILKVTNSSTSAHHLRITLAMPIAAGGRNPICVARSRPTSNESP